MAYTKEIAWGDGSSDKLYFSAPASEGNQTVEISSDANAGQERAKTVNFNASGVSPQALTVVQLAAGGTDFNAWLKDGDTHLWINIVMDDLKEVNLRLRMIGTIDWGDGTTESINVTSYTTKTHTYSDTGKYRIDLKPSSGTFYLGGGSNSYNVLGTRSNLRMRKSSILYQAEIGTKQITSLSAYAFYYCIGLQKIYIPKNITTLATYCLSFCYSLGWIEFEDEYAVTSCAAWAFYSSYNLKNDLDLDGALTSEGVVRGCNSIYGYTINPSVTSIAANGLNALYAIVELRCLPTTAPTATNTNAFTSLNANCVIKVPIGSLASYQDAAYWSALASQMVEAATVTMTLTKVTSSNKKRMTDKNASYTTTLTADEGYTLGTPVIKMGGTDITSSVYSDGVVNIPSVTGNITITATAS